MKKKEMKKVINEAVEILEACIQNKERTHKVVTDTGHELVTDYIDREQYLEDCIEHVIDLISGNIDLSK